MLKRFLVFIVFCAASLANVAKAECGGSVQCIGIGLSPEAAKLASHGLGPDTFAINFGQTAAGSMSNSQTVYVAAVTGPTGAMAVLGQISIKGSDADHFVLTGGSCSTTSGPVHGGAPCTVGVSFNPFSTGSFTASVHVPLNPAACVGCISERSFTVTGTGIIGPPGARPRTENVPFNTPQRIDLSTSVSGVITSYAITTPPVHGTVTLAGSIVTYTPTAGYFGPDSFAYSAMGPGGNTAPAIVTIVVGLPNAPTAGAKAVPVVFETPAAIELADVVSGVYTSLAIASQPAHGTVTLAGTVATYLPAKDFFGEDSFAYVAIGPGGTSTPGVVRLTVSALPPTASAATMQVNLNTPTTLNLLPFIRGSGISRIRIVTQPAHGGAGTTGAALTYTPNEDYFGTDSLTYEAIGLVGVSPPATLTINIVGRPDPSRNAAVSGLLRAQNETAKRFAGAQIANVQRRMEIVHRAESPTDATAAVAKVAASAAGSRAVELPAATGKSAGGTDFWVGGAVQFGKREADATRNEFTTSGVSLGFDRRLSEGFVIGAGVGAARDRTNIDADGSHSRARGFSGFIYGSHQPSANTFVDALFGAGSIDFTMRRFVKPISTYAEGERSGRQLFGSIATGYEYRENGVLLSPYARIEMARDRFDAVTETGAGRYALAYNGQTATNAKGAIGFRGEVAQETRFGFTTPRVRAEFQRDLRGERATSLHYANQPDGPRYLVTTQPTEKNALVLGFGNDFNFRGGLTVAVDYQTTRKSHGESDQSIRLNLTQSLGGKGSANWWESFDLTATRPLDVQVDAGFTVDDNVTRAQVASDRHVDQSAKLSLRKSYFFQPADDVRLVLSGMLGGTKFSHFAGLSRATVDFNADLQYRRAAEFTEPTYAAFLQAATDQYESRLRDGQRYTTGVAVQIPITDRLGAFAKLAGNWRSARSNVFSGRDVASSLIMDYSPAQHHSLYGGIEYRRGDNVTSGNPASTILSKGRQARSRVEFNPKHGEDRGAFQVTDDAFSALGFNTVRFKGQTGIATLGYNWSIGGANAFDLSLRRVQSLPNHAADTTIGAYVPTSRIRYTTNQLSLLYLLSF